MYCLSPELYFIFGTCTRDECAADQRGASQAALSRMEKRKTQKQRTHIEGLTPKANRMALPVRPIVQTQVCVILRECSYWRKTIADQTIK